MCRGENAFMSPNFLAFDTVPLKSLPSKVARMIQHAILVISFPDPLPTSFSVYHSDTRTTIQPHLFLLFASHFTFQQYPMFEIPYTRLHVLV